MKGMSEFPAFVSQFKEEDVPEHSHRWGLAILDHLVIHR